MICKYVYTPSNKMSVDNTTYARKVVLNAMKKRDERAVIYGTLEKLYAKVHTILDDVDSPFAEWTWRKGASIVTVKINELQQRPVIDTEPCVPTRLTEYATVYLGNKFRNDGFQTMEPVFAGQVLASIILTINDK